MVKTAKRSGSAISAADKAALTVEVAAWQDRRNAVGGTVDWRFTTDDARIKLKRLYPSTHE